MLDWEPGLGRVPGDDVGTSHCIVRFVINKAHVSRGKNSREIQRAGRK